jgi:hypothetical protein
MSDVIQKNLDQILAGFERNMIEKTLKDTYGNQSKAAKALGITKRKIQYKIRKYSIDCRNFKSRRLPDPSLYYPWDPSLETADGNRCDLRSLLLP